MLSVALGRPRQQQGRQWCRPPRGNISPSCWSCSDISDLCFSLLPLPGLPPPQSGCGGWSGWGTTFPLPLLALVKQEFKAAESIMRSKEDTAGWPLSKTQLLGPLWEYSLGTVPSVSKKPGGGLIFRTCRFWGMDFLLMHHVVFQTSLACLSLPVLFFPRTPSSLHALGPAPAPLGLQS